MKEIILKVPSISCYGCEISINEAFKNIDGIILIQPSHITKTVKVIYDENKITINKIINTIKEAGKEVEK